MQADDPNEELAANLRRVEVPAALRARVSPLVGQSTLGYTPGAILVDG